jgi:hypothetical protein
MALAIVTAGCGTRDPANDSMCGKDAPYAFDYADPPWWSKTLERCQTVRTNEDVVAPRPGRRRTSTTSTIAAPSAAFLTLGDLR